MPFGLLTANFQAPCPGRSSLPREEQKDSCLSHSNPFRPEWGYKPESPFDTQENVLKDVSFTDDNSRGGGDPPQEPVFELLFHRFDHFRHAPQVPDSP